MAADLSRALDVALQPSYTFVLPSLLSVNLLRTPRQSCFCFILDGEKYSNEKLPNFPTTRAVGLRLSPGMRPGPAGGGPRQLGSGHCTPSPLPQPFPFSRVYDSN